MRQMIAGLAAAALAACAGGAAQTDRQARAEAADAPQVRSVRAESLPPQTLEAGDCALFLFEIAPPREFVVFEHENERRAKIIHDGVVYEMGVAPQEEAYLLGQPFRRVYLHQRSGITFTLHGRVGEATGAGPRLEDAILRVRELDGTEIVRPLGGVRSCRGETG